MIRAEREVTRKLGNIMRVLGRKIPYSVPVKNTIHRSKQLLGYDLLRGFVVRRQVFSPMQEVRRKPRVVSKMTTLQNELARKQMYAVIRFARTQIMKPLNLHK
jgi:hypothetical protein